MAGMFTIDEEQEIRGKLAAHPEKVSEPLGDGSYLDLSIGWALASHLNGAPDEDVAKACHMDLKDYRRAVRQAAAKLREG